MKWLAQFWDHLTISTETLLLRAENLRLAETNLVLATELEQVRVDNRSLVNAQLKQSGIAPLPELETEKPPTIKRMRRLSLHQRQHHHEFMTDPRRIAEEKQHGNART